MNSDHTTPQVVETGVPEIIVRIHPDGCHQLVDLSRHTEGEIASYRQPAQLRMPPEVLTLYGDGARWVWFSNYWGGVFPTEELLVLSKYE